MCLKKQATKAEIAEQFSPTREGNHQVGYKKVTFYNKKLYSFLMDPGMNKSLPLDKWLTEQDFRLPYYSPTKNFHINDSRNIHYRPGFHILLNPYSKIELTQQARQIKVYYRKVVARGYEHYRSYFYTPDRYEYPLRPVIVAKELFIPSNQPSNKKEQAGI